MRLLCEVFGLAPEEIGLQPAPQPSAPVGQRIRRCRERQGISAKVLAELIGRSERWMQMVENGHTDPRVGDVRAMADALRVGVGHLVVDG